MEEERWPEPHSVGPGVQGAGLGIDLVGNELVGEVQQLSCHLQSSICQLPGHNPPSPPSPAARHSPWGNSSCRGRRSCTVGTTGSTAVAAAPRLLPGAHTAEKAHEPSAWAQEPTGPTIPKDQANLLVNGHRTELGLYLSRQPLPLPPDWDSSG